MGLSWATYFAQSVTSTLLKRSIPPIASQTHTDKGVAKISSSQPGKVSDFCYIDNLGILGVAKDDVKDCIDRSVANFGDANLLLHEIDLHEHGG